MGSVYNSVVSGINNMKKFTWVDGTKIGVLGHSFGAYQVNCLVTKTNVFAAAVSCSGISDLISHYGAIDGWGDSQEYDDELGQLRVGTTPWKNRETYIKNSPIFFADKITTPVLFMHNSGDRRVPWQQSMELFLAMRRLNEKAWLLNYEGEDHFINKKEDQLDFTIRLSQFFDHYLKGKPAPVWMTQQIHNRNDFMGPGLQLDTSKIAP